MNPIPDKGIFAPTLTNPDGQVFIMKAANLVENPDVNINDEASLKSFGDTLPLPDGLIHNVVQLTDDVVITINGHRSITSDDLDNKYDLCETSYSHAI